MILLAPPTVQLLALCFRLPSSYNRSPLPRASCKQALLVGLLPWWVPPPPDRGFVLLPPAGADACCSLVWLTPPPVVFFRRPSFLLSREVLFFPPPLVVNFSLPPARGSTFPRHTQFSRGANSKGPLPRGSKGPLVGPPGEILGPTWGDNGGEKI